MTDLIGLLARYNDLIINGLKETLYMVGLSLGLATLFGIPLGVMTTITAKGHIMECKVLNKVLNSIINIGRSVPFIILMVAIIPLTRWLVGTSIGTTAAIVPLSLAAIPFLGRVINNALMEISPGVIEAAQSMGAAPWQIIFKVLLPESLPAMILGITLTGINLIGYSAMAGAVGGGGLGDIAVRYGFQRFKVGIMIETVIVLVILVQLVQWLGNYLASRFDHR
ncbi:methionine ABC transporter permease [Halothermothrix orenii]|uniref:Binding-protein-dependent transport systems inner membrane component n=1 Tax=Halothermothrix orenii (strain H 168 / OCM 544 / DSM 9562) TaxID=373903 RepID=B8D0N8_HALOH|nr:methionine ABC transporter permease [Halothermothrix orenii]ACL70974.1 binding-protein-dependent transport systems inner membrane component [Halothermothrix orenii H 168]